MIPSLIEVQWLVSESLRKSIGEEDDGLSARFHFLITA